MQVKFVVRNLEKVQTYIRTVVPHGAVRVALLAIAEYMVGRPGQALRKYEPYKYVTRKRAYGRTWRSPKQRRWFWANGGPDMIGNNRTNKTANSWSFRETRGGYGITLANSSEGAKWIWSDRQAAQPRLVGHRTAREKIGSNLNGALRHAQAKVRQYLRSK